MESPWKKAHLESNSNLENTNFQKILTHLSTEETQIWQMKSLRMFHK